MIPILGTTFVALMGLAFGSFLNVCLTRWPKEECIVSPRSHCRDCYHVLTWWENVPLLSWLALRGRCRVCRAWIGWRVAKQFHVANLSRILRARASHTPGPHGTAFALLARSRVPVLCVPPEQPPVVFNREREACMSVGAE